MLAPVYEPFYAHLQYYYSRVVPRVQSCFSEEIYNQAQLCNRLFQHNVTNGLSELQMCCREINSYFFIAIIISFDSAFVT